MRAYTVVRGDNLSRIARRNGLRSWRDIYHHAANGRFRVSRPNPNLIYPGDIINIPDPSEVNSSRPARRARPRTAPVVSQPTTTVTQAQPQTSQSPPVEEADEADLNAASTEEIEHRVRTERRFAPWRSAILAYLNRLTPERIQTMTAAGVSAVLFGGAQTRRPAATTWDEDYHRGTALRTGYRVNTTDGDSAILLFLPEFSSVVMSENTLVIIYGRREGPARRRTSRAVLERGALRDRLDELRGGGN